MDEQPPPKSSIEHLKKQEEPIPLDYGRARYPQDRAKSGPTGQVFLGFFFWIGAVIVALVLLNTSGGNGMFNFTEGVLLPIELVSVIGFSIFLRVKYNWRGFIPGVLIGLALTCLVPLGIAAVVCGNWK